MPVEIRELVIKAVVAVDWENKTIDESKENIVCAKEDVAGYVNEYFRKNNSRTLLFDQSKLCDFILEWQASLVTKP